MNSATATRKNGNAGPPASQRVLVVEDDEGLNNLARKALRRAGFDACGALTGGEAIERIMADPDLALLLDQQLPDMTGAELVRILMEKDRRVPFVVMTGRGDEKTAVEMMKLGARDYLVKTIDLAERLPEVFQRIFREIDTEKRLAAAERALKESEERFRVIFEGSRDAIFLTSRDARFVDVNHAACALTGYPKDALLAMRIPDLHAPEDTGAFDRFFGRIMAGEAIVSEADILRKDGDKVRTEFTNTRVFIGNLPYMHTIARDVTERKRAEAERTRLEQQYHRAQKMESIGRLSGGVAHDLNNLLSPIIGFGEMLLEDLAAGDPRREHAAEIVKAGLKARDLVRQLLAFGRKQTLNFKPININDLLKNLEKLLRRTIREDIAIQWGLAPSLPPVLGDAGQIEQVVMNLAVNAQDAMPDGGMIFIETGHAESAPEAVTEPAAMPAGPYVTLRIRDTGAGMDAHTRENIFEPFFTTKEKGKGTGLGLATVFGIVKQHGGNIAVSSEPGRGAVFTVYLPAAEDPEREHPPDDFVEIAPAVAGNGGETILLAEDDPQVRNLALALLKRRGYRVLAAADGRAALAALDRYDGPVHLLLTDVVMPGMNGRELHEKASAVRPGLRALFMSGHDDDVITQRGVMAPGIHFIQKPFSNSALIAKIREVLGEAPTP